MTSSLCRLVLVACWLINMRKNTVPYPVTEFNLKKQLVVCCLQGRVYTCEITVMLTRTCESGFTF